MNKMRNELVSFETGKLAKEKGFRVPTETHYELSLTESIDEEDGKSGPFGWEKGELNCQSGYFINNWKETDYSNRSWYQCSAPTQSLLQRWLREEHNIHVEIVMGDCPGESDDVEYFVNLKLKHSVKLEMDLHSQDLQVYGIFTTYEEALEVGLQKSLNLIK